MFIIHYEMRYHLKSVLFCFINRINVLSGNGEGWYLILSMCVCCFFVPVYEGEFGEFFPISVRDSSPKLNRDCFRWQSLLLCHTSISQFYLNFCLPNNFSHCEVFIIPSSSQCWSLFESWNQYKIFIVCFSTVLFSRKQGIEMIQVRYPYGIFLSFYGCSMTQKGAH